MIKMVVFDFTGVIVSGGHKSLCKKLGEVYNLPTAKVYEHFYTRYFNDFCLSKIGEKEAWQKPMDELGIKVDWRELRDKYYLSSHRANRPLLRWAMKLRKKYRLVILSKNVPKYFREERRQFGLDKIFHAAINTADLNLPKASPKTIQYVLDNYHLRPQETVYMDDQEANLLAPKSWE